MCHKLTNPIRLLFIPLEYATVFPSTDNQNIVAGKTEDDVFMYFAKRLSQDELFSLIVQNRAYFNISNYSGEPLFNANFVNPIVTAGEIYIAANKSEYNSWAKSNEAHALKSSFALLNIINFGKMDAFKKENAVVLHAVTNTTFSKDTPAVRSTVEYRFWMRALLSVLGQHTKFEALMETNLAKEVATEMDYPTMADRLLSSADNGDLLKFGDIDVTHNPM